MNDTQVVITVGYGITVVISAVVMALVFRSTRQKADDAGDHERLAKLENGWGILVAVLLVLLLGLTIFSVPYDNTEARDNQQVVEVTAQQYGWAIQPSTVKAGEPVRFELESKDVQHGFGVYQDWELVFQVQVPAKDQNPQRYVHTFDEPGTYDVLCLEFCGFQHHNMRGQLKVTQ